MIHLRLESLTPAGLFFSAVGKASVGRVVRGEGILTQIVRGLKSELGFFGAMPSVPACRATSVRDPAVRAAA